jgi:hypothetical protein
VSVIRVVASLKESIMILRAFDSLENVTRLSESVDGAVGCDNGVYLVSGGNRDDETTPLLEAMEEIPLPVTLRIELKSYPVSRVTCLRVFRPVAVHGGEGGRRDDGLRGRGQCNGDAWLIVLGNPGCWRREGTCLMSKTTKYTYRTPALTLNMMTFNRTVAIAIYDL